jgi:hypothetical protein
MLTYLLTETAFGTMVGEMAQRRVEHVAEAPDAADPVVADVDAGSRDS